MKHNAQGRFETEFDDKALLKFYVEYADKSILREEALKRRISLSDLCRNAISHFIKQLTK